MFEGIKAICTGLKTSKVGAILKNAPQAACINSWKKKSSKDAEDKDVEVKIPEDQLTKNKKPWSGGDYIYTANGEETYGQIKEALGLKDGVLRERNSSIFEKIEGNADDVVPEKGTELKIYEVDLPSKSADFKDDEGELLDGFKISHNGQVFYEVQSGDTQTSIYKKLGNECFKYYKTDDIMRGYPEETLQPGTKISIYEKGWLGKLLAKLGIF